MNVKFNLTGIASRTIKVDVSNIDVLCAISVVAKRLAQTLFCFHGRQTMEKKEA